MQKVTIIYNRFNKTKYPEFEYQIDEYMKALEIHSEIFRHFLIDPKDQILIYEQNYRDIPSTFTN